MRVSEKQTFIRFLLIYMGISALLFIITSLYYYYDQTQQIEDAIAKEMNVYGSYYRANKELKDSKEYGVKLLPKGTLPYPAFLDINGSYMSTSCGGLDFPHKIVAIYAKPEVIANKKKYIKEKILIFMSLAFVANLFIAFFLAWISMQPVRKKNQEFEEFVDDVIHDLNAPISAISINLESLSEKCQYKQIIRIGKSVDTIRNLYSNLEVILKNSYKGTPKIIDIHEYIQTMIEQVQPLYPDINFESKVPSLQVKIDSFAFERILINLIQNAAKYTKENPHVIFGLDSKKRFFIQDNGIGIMDPKLLHRAQQSNKANKGYGLGLSIVKKLSEDCQISFEIESKENEGTTFFFDISKHIMDS